ncbi:MAG: nitrilase, partial [Gemmataceae bacterium]|nr:nitrilase [Gemmataceae bacterium]
MLRYWAACCQTDFANPKDRGGIADRVSAMLAMVDRAVVGYRPFGDVKLVVFPEFAHAAPIYETVEELRDRLAVRIPNEHTERYQKKAR